MIYFVQRADGAIKIGTTEHYHQRKWELQAKYGKLSLLGTMDGDRSDEKRLHQQFSEHRVIGTDGIEWFYPVTSITAFIAENTTTKVPANTRAVLSVRKQTHERVKDLSYGLGLSIEDTVQFLLDRFLPEGKNPLEFGLEIRKQLLEKVER